MNQIISATIFLAALVIQAKAVQTPVALGTAANYVIFAKAGITTTGTTAIVGDIGISPAAAKDMTGFALTLSGDGTYSTSPLVTGKIYAASYASPTPSNLTAVAGFVEAAYTDAAGRINPDYYNYGAGTVSGVTLTAGLYKWTSPLTVGGTVTLSGSSSDVFIFQVAGTITFNGDANIVLSGVSAGNIFWASAGAVTLNGGAAVKGTILGKTGIVFKSGANLITGRALAQTAVTMIANSLTIV